MIVAHVRHAKATRGVDVVSSARWRFGTTLGRVDGSGMVWIRRPFRSLLRGRCSTGRLLDPRTDCGPGSWARHGAGHTRSFDQQVPWSATRRAKKVITELMRIAWRTVGSIIDWAWVDTAAGIDALAGLIRIGIDEIAYKRERSVSIQVSTPTNPWLTISRVLLVSGISWRADRSGRLSANLASASKRRTQIFHFGS